MSSSSNRNPEKAPGLFALNEVPYCRSGNDFVLDYPALQVRMLDHLIMLLTMLIETVFSDLEGFRLIWGRRLENADQGALRPGLTISVEPSSSQKILADIELLIDTVLKRLMQTILAPHDGLPLVFGEAVFGLIEAQVKPFLVRFGGKTIAQPLVFRNRAGEELIFSGNFAPRPDVTACELRRADLPVYIAGLEKMDRFVKLQYVHLPGKSDWVGYDSGRFEELKELLGTDHVRIATIAWCIDANGREFMALKDLQPPPENPPFELE